MVPSNRAVEAVEPGTRRERRPQAFVQVFCYFVCLVWRCSPFALRHYLQVTDAHFARAIAKTNPNRAPIL
jgi:hypothetical protein